MLQHRSTPGEVTKSMANTSNQWRFTVDPEVCSGHGRCYSLAPQWFTADESGYGNPADGTIPDSAHADMQFVADSCPEQAISIVAADAGQES
jgi:ferredoxin